MRLSRIRIYPVKSTRGSELAEAPVEPWGLRDDRRWLVVDAAGDNLTARTNDRMLTVTATPTPDGISLTAPGYGSLAVPRPSADAESLPTPIRHLDRCRAAGKAADDWLSEVLGAPVRLGWQDDPQRRPVADDHGGRPGDHVSLADDAPLLLTTTASLDRLNEWVSATRAERGEPAGDPLSMVRFRPNVVVDGAAEPFAEDGWDRVTIGSVPFRFAERCDRCVLTTIDPDTRVHGKEPIRTLSRHRRHDGKVWFGVRLIPLATGTIRLDDPITLG
ncbi:molybdenum cofactor biosysynthesis protein [Actinocatenispora thailandica]|uniref:Molybdenum cofactor biosysynthesis protein n=1 Tax=Actinocatenispora thailandica TaxID=227318 RepID=A0A7R7HVG1_9ACTN|nr:MOSC N-terminal beta barrel domain-containing protein [Actinocatenispora thailandica]BCJ33546.1 molybdenum cofactor biosysynthesis protein [Actinocatenispora thailandica]